MLGDVETRRDNPPRTAPGRAWTGEMTTRSQRQPQRQLRRGARPEANPHTFTDAGHGAFDAPNLEGSTTAAVPNSALGQAWNGRFRLGLLSGIDLDTVPPFL